LWELTLQIKGVSTALLFSKPSDLLDITRIRGSCLTFNEKGLISIDVGPSKVPNPTKEALEAEVNPTAFKRAKTMIEKPVSVPPAALYAYPQEIRDQIRRYAVLVRILKGNPVTDMHRFRDGNWELESMIDQLFAPIKHTFTLPAPPATADETKKGEDGTLATTAAATSAAVTLHGSTAAKVAELVYWREATDVKTGNKYWWHTVTWARQWAPPMVDGKGPYDWYPHLKDLKMGH
jgi:hypothetical protein